MTNFAVILVLSITARILGIDRFLTANGLNLGMLLAFAALIGFGGSWISLMTSKWMAKTSVGAQIITEPRNSTERWLVQTVAWQAKQAGIAMPEVAIYNSPEINAFATGPSRNNSLVAVSSGLLQNMSQAEAEAVLAHEVSHVANGDMVTLTLIQGVVNTFVIFFARIIGFAVDNMMRRDNDSYSGPGMGYYIGSIVGEIVLGILATTVVMWFSRQREYRADAGGAALAGREKMIAALERLRLNQGQSHMPDQLAAFGIAGGIGSGLKQLFLSHPPLDQRIAALKASI